VAIQTGCLLASSYMCGVMSLAITRRMRLGTYLAAVATFALGAAFLALELREFAGMIARGAGPQVSGFLSALLHACRLPRAARHRRPGVVDRDDGPGRCKGFHAVVQRRLQCFSLFWHFSTSSGSGCSTVVYLMEYVHDRRVIRSRPGDRSTLLETEERGSSGLLVYTIGLVLSVILTATSFWVPTPRCSGGRASRSGWRSLAVAQMGIHLVFFLHITTGPDNTNNVLALAFGILIVTVGCRRIAYYHGQSQRQHDDAGRADAYAALMSLGWFSTDHWTLVVGA